MKKFLGSQKKEISCAAELKKAADKQRNKTLIDIGKKLELNKFLHLIQFMINIFHYRGILSAKLISIKEIMAGNFPNVEILSAENVHLYYASPAFNDGSNRKQELSEGREYIQYALIIKNAIVYGDSNLIDLSTKKVLFDMPVLDEAKRYKYTDNSTKIINIRGKNVLYWKGLTHTLDEAIWMGGNYSWNYYHLLYEFVIKFLQLNTLNIPADVPVLIDQTCLEIPQFKELLDIANKKKYPLVGLDRRSRMKVGELIFVGCPNFIPPNIKIESGYRPDDTQFNISALRDLRSHFLPYSSQKEFPKRIFISRKNASARRKFNEEEIVQTLSEFEFVVVYPETLSVADQISLFSQAEWIIGGSGAAFANLLFCQPACNVVISTKMRFVVSTFSTIAKALDVNLVYITEEDTNKNVCFKDIHEAYKLDPSYLRNYLINSGL